MYLSLLELNTQNKEVRRDVANQYEMHSTLKRAFTNINERFLWRLENKYRGYPAIIVQSASKPSWGNITIEDYFINYEFKDYNITEFLNNREILRFRIEANPTIKKDGRRRALITIEEQRTWIYEKAKKSGFNIQALTIEKPQLISVTKRKTGDVIQIHSVLYEGILQIISIELFIRALESGLGPAKAFGFGLLSVARC